MKHDYKQGLETIINIYGDVPEGISDRYIHNVLLGLSQYAKQHKCDFGRDVIIHNNYLGTLVDIDLVSMKLTNAYVTIKIDKDKIHFYAKVDGYVGDLDLIIDHLRAPYSNNDRISDGFSMYNFYYTVEQKSSTIDYGPEKYNGGVFDRISVFDDQNNFLYTKNEKINQ